MWYKFRGEHKGDSPDTFKGASSAPSTKEKEGLQVTVTHQQVSLHPLTLYSPSEITDERP